ncbi:MAG: alanine:cation symporter family protein, partial [Alphaproteobacteria bacterium]|nr:alanine:cation symporter family protein [Alphaproteobacteria bacterium]
VVFLGAVAPGATAVFFFSDPMMGILALVNLVAIMMLLPTCLRILRDFRHQLKSGIERPVLNPDNFPDLDIDRTAWTGKVAEQA